MLSSKDEVDYEYEAELVWCIKYLEKELIYDMSKVRERTANNNAEKRIKSIQNAIKILSNPKLTKIKKRVTMKSMCSDYRDKMRSEINKKSIKNEISNAVIIPKSKAIRKSTKINSQSKDDIDTKEFKFIF